MQAKKVAAQYYLSTKNMFSLKTNTKQCRKSTAELTTKTDAVELR